MPSSLTAADPHPGLAHHWPPAPQPVLGRALSQPHHSDPVHAPGTSTSQPHPGQAHMYLRSQLGNLWQVDQALAPNSSQCPRRRLRAAGVAGADLAVRSQQPQPKAPLRRALPCLHLLCLPLPGLSPGSCCGSASSRASGQSLNLSQAAGGGKNSTPESTSPGGGSQNLGIWVIAFLGGGCGEPNQDGHGEQEPCLQPHRDAGGPDAGSPLRHPHAGPPVPH